MPYDWILDVLTDLQSFAGMNGLEKLAAHLDETLEIASAEIARASGDNVIAFQAAAAKGYAGGPRAGCKPAHPGCVDAVGRADGGDEIA